MLLRVENASFGYAADRPLFSDISFSVNEGDRIGLVGDNGAGKSTLLRCTLGLEELDAGEIITPRAAGKISYIPQDLPDDLRDKSFAEYLLAAIPEDERSYSEWKVDAAMDDLSVPAEIRNLPLAKLSGGWQRMALIARANIDEPDIILMDEPTNYLDLDKIFRLENWLRNSVKAAYIAVSHDRKFLDACTNKTMHLRAGRLIMHGAPYSNSRASLMEEDIASEKRRALEETEIARIRAAAKRIRLWSAGNNPGMDKKANAMFARAERLDAKKTDAYKPPRRDINFNPDGARPNILLAIKNAEIKTPDGRLLFKIPDMQIMKGDRAAILAMNGVGKTQMIMAIMRAYEAKDETGPIRFNPQANVGYFDQHIDSLPKDKTIVEFIESLGVVGGPATKLLIDAGFPYKNHTQRIGRLSQGERARLAFLGLKIGRHNFFVMDEPTNHIDIDGQEKFEDAVISEGHTCLFVSHDRYMMENVANKYFQVDKGVLRRVNTIDPFYAQVRRG